MIPTDLGFDATSNQVYEPDQLDEMLTEVTTTFCSEQVLKYSLGRDGKALWKFLCRVAALIQPPCPQSAYMTQSPLPTA